MRTFAVPAASRDSLEESAKRILAEFDPEMLRRPKALNVEKLLNVFMSKKFGWDLDVQESDLLPRNVLAYSDPKSKTVVIPSPTHDGLGSDGRCRFTATHEFVHVAEHRAVMAIRMIAFDEKEEVAYRKARGEIKPYLCAEWQADYMAGALLMPFEQVLAIYEREKWDRERTIQEMMREFVVSYTAATVRLRYIDKKRAAK